MGPISTTTEYTLYSAGDKPPAGTGRPPAGGPDAGDARCELAAVTFSSKKALNPRRMEVALPQTRWRPRTSDDDVRHDDSEADDGVVSSAVFRPFRDQDSICHTLNLAQGQGAQNVLHSDRIVVLHMRESKYDPLSSCLVDFKARANMASVKNFQLIKSPPVEDHHKKEYYHPDGEGVHENPKEDATHPIILQMGKVGKRVAPRPAFPFLLFPDLLPPSLGTASTWTTSSPCPCSRPSPSASRASTRTATSARPARPPCESPPI